MQESVTMTEAARLTRRGIDSICKYVRKGRLHAAPRLPTDHPNTSIRITVESLRALMPHLRDTGGRRGRPRLQVDVPAAADLAIKLPPDQSLRINEVAARRGISRSEAARQAIAAGLDVLLSAP
jgi:hypothetical protein